MAEPPVNLAQLLPLAAERNPDGPAIIDRGTTITWAEADRRAGRLAAAAARAGVGRGERLGIHHRKGAESFLAMHAAVRLGAVAVPLDPTASAAYLGSVIEQSGCRVMLTEEGCRLSALEVAETAQLSSVIGLADDPDGARSPCALIGPDAIATLDPIAGLAAELSDDDPAYLITTSGSTGRPKGIGHTHGSALAYVRFKLAAYDFTADDRIADVAPNHFDISTQALWVTPAIGATNVVVPEQYQMLPASLAGLMADERLSVWYGVPYLLTQLLTRAKLEDHDLSALRWVLFGGEVFPPQVLAALMEQLPGARFSNVYGPAEVNACTVHHLTGPPEGEEPVPIGAPVAGTEVRLVEVDTEGEPTEGGRGEIWVRAATMMRGYWQQPELTARSIVSWRGDRWYRTGDLGLRRPDDSLVFAGRIDHQVKVRGYRVELESIESLLEDAAGVASAIATVATAPDGSDVVIAGLIPEPGATPDPDQIARWAHEQMPAYAVPRHFYPVGSAPVTGSGKLDRREIRRELRTLHDGGGSTRV